MSPRIVKSFPAPAGTNYKDFLYLPVRIIETDGVTHVSLWTDPTTRPDGVINTAVDAEGGLCGIVVFGESKVRVAAGGLAAGAGTHHVRCIGAGASDAIKAQVTALAAAASHFSLGRFLERTDVAAGGLATILVNPSATVV